MHHKARFHGYLSTRFPQSVADGVADHLTAGFKSSVSPAPQLLMVTGCSGTPLAYCKNCGGNRHFHERFDCATPRNSQLDLQALKKFYPWMTTQNSDRSSQIFSSH